jgi:hypothetical protein
MPTAAQKTYVFRLPDMTLTSKGGDQNWTYIDIDMGELEDLGPYLAAMTVHTRTQSKSASVQWKLSFYWSVDGKTWNPVSPTDVFAAVAADGQAIQTPYTDATKFGIKLRFVYAVRASTGTAVESVNVGGYIVADVKS